MSQIAIVPRVGRVSDLLCNVHTDGCLPRGLPPVSCSHPSVGKGQFDRRCMTWACPCGPRHTTYTHRDTYFMRFDPEGQELPAAYTALRVCFCERCACQPQTRCGAAHIYMSSLRRAQGSLRPVHYDLARSAKKRWQASSHAGSRCCTRVIWQNVNTQWHSRRPPRILMLNAEGSVHICRRDNCCNRPSCLQFMQHLPTNGQHDSKDLLIHDAVLLSPMSNQQNNVQLAIFKERNQLTPLVTTQHGNANAHLSGQHNT